MYSVDDPAATSVLYGISSPHPKSAWYSGFADPRIPDHNLFSARNRAFHAAMRRKMGSMYSMSAIKSYEPYVDNCINVLLQQLERYIEKDQPADLQHWMQCYAFDVIGEITVRRANLPSHCFKLTGVGDAVWRQCRLSRVWRPGY